jgi:hypothetical protein
LLIQKMPIFQRMEAGCLQEVSRRLKVIRVDPVSLLLSAFSLLLGHFRGSSLETGICPLEGLQPDTLSDMNGTMHVTTTRGGRVV